MKNIINDDDFTTILEGKRGTHSTIQIVKMRSRRCGCSEDETDTRTRWKQKCQQYPYTNTILPCPYKKVAAAICKEGPIHY